MFSFYPVSSAAFSSAKVTGAANLFGVYASGLIGTVTPRSTEAESGVFASGLLGTVTPFLTPASSLNGVVANGLIANIGPVTPNGVVANGYIGTIIPGPVIAISGVSATGTAGALGGDWYWTEIDDDQLYPYWTPITTLQENYVNVDA